GFQVSRTAVLETGTGSLPRNQQGFQANKIAYLRKDWPPAPLRSFTLGMTHSEKGALRKATSTTPGLSNAPDGSDSLVSARLDLEAARLQQRETHQSKMRFKMPWGGLCQDGPNCLNCEAPRTFIVQDKLSTATPPPPPPPDSSMPRLPLSLQSHGFSSFSPLPLL
ncbi:hypothetical protein CYMTET_6232, partial [Cymbomonas tetramitiformis]